MTMEPEQPKHLSCYTPRRKTHNWEIRLALYFLRNALLGLALGLSLNSVAMAGKVTDRHGNEAYDTAEECDAAVRAGKARFYKPHTQQRPQLREGEASVKSMMLRDLTIPPPFVTANLYGAATYQLGACDIGVGRSGGRDGVSVPLQGKFVPYAPTQLVNVYYDKAGNPVRVAMQQCDNWFGHRFPRPVATQVAQQCPPEAATPGTPQPKISVPEAKR